MNPFAETTAEFDFESILSLPQLADAPQSNNSFGLGSFKKLDPKHRTVVCLHWLQGLCQNGEKCGYLHRLDKSRMPPCKHGQLCKIKNCPLKHDYAEDYSECIFFRQGFCMHGPACKFRHIKRPPDDCPTTAPFDQYVVSGNVPLSKKRKTHQPNQYYKITLCKHWLENGSCPYGEECHYAHGEAELKIFPGNEDQDDSDVYDAARNQMDAPLVLPFSSTAKVTYFLLCAPDLRSLTHSRHQGKWAVSTALAKDINDAAYSSEHVVFYFYVRPLRGLYGAATIHGGVNMQPSMQYPNLIEFPLQWTKLCRVSIKLVAQLKTQTGQTISRSTGDSKLDKAVGFEILLIMLRKENWDWSTEIEKANGPLETQLEWPPDPSAMFPIGWDRTASSVPGAFAHKDFYSGHLSGYVFPISMDTMQESFARCMFGLPPNRLEEAQKHIRVGSPIILQDIHTGIMYGVFEAATEVVENMEPNAWKNARSYPLPVQVRFVIAFEAPPLPLNDGEVYRVFNNRKPAERIGPLTLPETVQIINLFAQRGGLWVPPADTFRPPNRGFQRGPRPMFDAPHNAPGGGGGGHCYYKPPHKHFVAVPVGIPFTGDGFHVRKRLLGPQASLVSSIVNQFGNPKSIKIRIRGRGSGFKEGPHGEEADEPMQFMVSADDEAVLPLVVNRVKELIEHVRRELQG